MHVGYNLIRLGGTSDGAYLVPDCLSGIGACFSPGICGITSFEEHLSAIYSIPCFLCDPLDSDISTTNHLIRFDRLSLAASTTDSSITLSDWIAKYNMSSHSPFLLSMDIEGAEIEVISALSHPELSLFRIITLELHYLHLLHDPAASNYASAVLSCIQKLSDQFDIVHFKPNNNCPFRIVTEHGPHTLYTCVELTFLNKQCRRHSPIAIPFSTLPNILDIRNTLDKPGPDYSFYHLCTL